MEGKLDIKDRQYTLKSYKKCFVGDEAIKIIKKLNFASNDTEAIAFGNKLIQSDIIEHVNRDHMFKNAKLFYRFTQKYYQSLITNSNETYDIEPPKELPIEPPQKEDEDTKQPEQKSIKPRQVPQGGGGNSGYRAKQV